ncbi:MAG TPA: iron-sulfur cluster assembly accessory protein [Candidatus Saccharimonadaceae bacterium]|jgi:iron-sulfur cluster assembly accessory protein|nr:iron-sulfur cluster assembly accessory protein [Candidatus Saccharimonadaceae bacterium]
MLTLTDAATRKLGEVIAQQSAQGQVFGLRLSVYRGGCSGYQYGMSLAEQAEQGDWVGEFGGVKVLVDSESAPLLDGVNIDYVETLQASGFTISNPNAARGCGCGKSFETEESASASEAGGGCGGGCGCGGH